LADIIDFLGFHECFYFGFIKYFLLLVIFQMICEEMRGEGIEVPETSSEAEENDGAEKKEDGSRKEGNDGSSSSDNDDDDGGEASSDREGASPKVDIID
jgi:hypothetical protein